MFAICIEASHSKGMGHLFRMLNFATYLGKKNQPFIFIINDNKKTSRMLTDKNMTFEVADFNNYSLSWEAEIINKYSVNYWVNDRLDTHQQHALNVKKTGIKLITFDDMGSGAKESDINICGLFFNRENIEGKQVLKGVRYLILNDEIDLYKRERTSIKKILVTLGGSDTYGVTIKVVKMLQSNNIKATIHHGASFDHIEELKAVLTDKYQVINNIPSLIEEFSNYDLAITGGGITPFEANASGLPCLIIANEIFEIPNGQFLEQMESSKYLGFHAEIDNNVLEGISQLDINSMSLSGMHNLKTNAVEKIYNNILHL